MEEVKCACGATYAPKDRYAVKRHETSVKHLINVRGTGMTEEAFSDLDDETPAPIEKPKRKRATKSVASFADLDKTEAAKSFTEDERLSISSTIANSAGVHDLDQSAESIAKAFIDAAGNINADILGDLETYVIGVVAVVRANGNGETPSDTAPAVVESDDAIDETPDDETPVERPKRASPKPGAASKPAKATPVSKPKTRPETKAKAKPKTAAKATGDKKPCRVCEIIKPLDQFRKKSSRPDGRDTICATCAKAWDDTHKAVR